MAINTHNRSYFCVGINERNRCYVHGKYHMTANFLSSKDVSHSVSRPSYLKLWQRSCIDFDASLKSQQSRHLLNENLCMHRSLKGDIGGPVSGPFFTLIYPEE